MRVIVGLIIEETLVGYQQHQPVHELTMLSEDKQFNTIYARRLDSGVSVISRKKPQVDKQAASGKRGNK